MSSNHLYSLVAPVTAPTAGAAFPCAPMRDKTVQVSGTFSATLQLEGSLDGVAWSSLGATITANAIRAIPEAIHYIRVNTTVFVSGVPVVKLSGFTEA